MQQIRRMLRKHCRNDNKAKLIKILNIPQLYTPIKKYTNKNVIVSLTSFY